MTERYPGPATRSSSGYALVAGGRFQRASMSKETIKECVFATTKTDHHADRLHDCRLRLSLGGCYVELSGVQACILTHVCNRASSLWNSRRSSQQARTARAGGNRAPLIRLFQFGL